MRIGLIDVDGHNFPNIPLMKLSAWHKHHGDTVEWYMPFGERYDLVYMSKVFSFTPDYDLAVNADRVIRGGSGYAIRTVCDPNILASKDWRILFRQLIASGAEIDFNQGLDIRLMTKEKANMIDAMRIKDIHFAWDNYEDKDIILPKLRMFAKNTLKKPHSHNGTVYMLTNYNTTFEQDLYRIYTLRKMNYWPFVMVYDRKNADNEYRRLQRWVNNRAVFMSVAFFEDYKG